MAASIQIDALITAISNLSVSGVSIKTLSGIQDRYEYRAGTGILYPNPEAFVTELSVEANTYDSGASAKKTARYTLNYRYLHEPVSANRLNLAGYSGMVTNAVAILNALIDADDPSPDTVVDLTPTCSNFGPVSDPSGSTWWHGCDIQVHITEFIN